jgi:hypothetical protein
VHYGFGGQVGIIYWKVGFVLCLEMVIQEFIVGKTWQLENYPADVLEISLAEFEMVEIVLKTLQVVRTVAPQNQKQVKNVFFAQVISLHEFFCQNADRDKVLPVICVPIVKALREKRHQIIENRSQQSFEVIDFQIFFESQFLRLRVEIKHREQVINAIIVNLWDLKLFLMQEYQILDQNCAIPFF